MKEDKGTSKEDSASETQSKTAKLELRKISTLVNSEQQSTESLHVDLRGAKDKMSPLTPSPDSNQANSSLRRAQTARASSKRAVTHQQDLGFFNSLIQEFDTHQQLVLG